MGHVYLCRQYILESQKKKEPVLINFVVLSYGLLVHFQSMIQHSIFFFLDLNVGYYYFFLIRMSVIWLLLLSNTLSQLRKKSFKTGPNPILFAASSCFLLPIVCIDGRYMNLIQLLSHMHCGLREKKEKIDCPISSSYTS